MAGKAAVGWTVIHDRCVARVCGEIDIANAEAVSDAVQAGREGHNLIVDLTHVTFIDCSALRQFITLWKQTNLSVVAPVERQPRSVLNLTNLCSVIPTFDTLDSALGNA